jgi:hypothetical protein
MRLKSMADKQIPAERIAMRLRRTEGAVRAEAARQHVMLAPTGRKLALTEKRPYGGIRVAPRRSVARKIEPPQAETLF